jgi:hypothetical protein
MKHGSATLTARAPKSALESNRSSSSFLFVQGLCLFLGMHRDKLDVETFERMMSRLDRANLHAPVRLTEAASVTKFPETLATPLYEYFKEKLSHTGGFSVAPILKPDDPEGSTVRDPYVAFRRRIENMKTRRHQQKNEQLYVGGFSPRFFCCAHFPTRAPTRFMHMVKLKRDLSRCRDILETVRAREQHKHALLQKDRQVYAMRYALKDWDGSLEAKLTPKPPPPPPPPTPPPLPTGPGLGPGNIPWARQPISGHPLAQKRALASAAKLFPPLPDANAAVMPGGLKLKQQKRKLAPASDNPADLYPPYNPYMPTFYNFFYCRHAHPGFWQGAIRKSGRWRKRSKKSARRTRTPPMASRTTKKTTTTRFASVAASTFITMRCAAVFFLQNKLRPPAHSHCCAQPIYELPTRLHREGQYALVKDGEARSDPALRGYVRRRVGRGGRVFIDRIRPDYDSNHELTWLTKEQEADYAEQKSRLLIMREKVARHRQQLLQQHLLQQQQRLQGTGMSVPAAATGEAQRLARPQNVAQVFFS